MIAIAIGSDVVLKAAAGVIAALLAGGAAYKAATARPPRAPPPPARKHAPMVRRVLLATPASTRSVRAAAARAPGGKRPSRPGTRARRSVVRTHREPRTRALASTTTGITKRT